MRKIIYVVLVAVVFVSCSKKPEFVHVENVAITGMKDSLLQLSMDYVVYNPNDVKTSLKQSGMEIFYEETAVGKGFLDKQIKLAPNDTIKVPIRFQIALKKLHKFYGSLLKSDSAVFQVKGTSKIGFMLNSFTLVMDDEIHLNTRKIIHEEIRKNLSQEGNFKIKSIEANKIPSLSKTALLLHVETQNNLPLDYEINQMELQFFLKKENQAVAHWQLNAPILQTALQTAQIPVEATLHNFDLLKQLSLNWLTEKKVNFKVVGEVEIKIQEYTFTIPIKDNLSYAL